MLSTDIVTLIVAAGVAVITSVFTWIAGHRSKAHTDRKSVDLNVTTITDALTIATSGFDLLTRRLIEDNTALRSEIAAERSNNAVLQTQIIGLQAELAIYKTGVGKARVDAESASGE